MKKVFVLMAIAAMVMTACKEKPVGPDTPDNPVDEPEEYVQPIDIDGDFSDWAKLDASKVVTAKCADGSSKPDLKLMKVYSDENFIFIYVEYDFSNYGADELTTSHFDIHLNGDNNKSTGGWNGQWAQGDTPCIDLMCQGDIIDETGNFIDFDPGMYKYAGDANTSEWSWDDVTVAGFVTAKGNKKGMEIQLTRELYPLGTMSEDITLGVEILVNGWDATGALPNAEATEDNPAGPSDLLFVPMNK